MKHYLLSVYRPDDMVIEPSVLEAFTQKLNALVEEMRAADAFVFAGGLEAADMATVVQLKGDDVVTTDGPFIEDKWHANGLVIIKAPDLDAALEWGRELAKIVQVTKLPVEVRAMRFE